MRHGTKCGLIFIFGFIILWVGMYNMAIIPMDVIAYKINLVCIGVQVMLITYWYQKWRDFVNDN